MADAVLIMQFSANPNRYGLNGSDAGHITRQGLINADVYDKGSGVTARDAISIQKLLLDLLTSLPESVDKLV